MVWSLTQLPLVGRIDSSFQIGAVTRPYEYEPANCIEKKMKNRTMALKTPVAFCAAISLLSCSDTGQEKNDPSTLEFGTTVSAITGVPTPLTPATGQDVPAIFTYTWTLADDDTDRIRIWINHAGGTDFPFLTRTEAGCVSPNLNCSYTSPALGIGNATWWLLAFDDGDNSNSAWTTGISYTIGNTGGVPPGLPIPTAPLSGIDVTSISTYTWTLPDDFATTVQVWINHAGGNFDNAVLTRAGANCASPDLNCSYTSPPLNGGDAEWFLNAFDAFGQESGWTTGINYTVDTNARAVLVAPTAGDTPVTSFNPPDFSWTGVASSSSYTLWVADSDPNNNTADWQVSYTPAQAGCVAPDDTCFLTGAFLTGEAFPALSNGRVDWFIQTSNDNWSVEGQFTSVAPCGNDPLGATCDDSNSCTDDSCDTGTDPAGVCVNADNASACDDNNACTTGDICNSGQCRATDQAACTVSTTGALPAGVTLDVNQDYTWPEVAGVLSYRVVVQNRDTNAYVLNGSDGSSVLATNVCAGGVCAIEPSQLPNGRFRWWVQTPPLVGGCCTLLNGHETWHGPWMTGVTFEVGRSERPTAIAPLDMQTTIDRTPDLTWTAIGGSNHNYDVWITDANGVSTETRITSGAAACPFPLDTCRLTAATLPLGTTYWWVEANDSALWSFRSAFVIE